MRISKIFNLVIAISITCFMQAQDWNNISVPANASHGKTNGSMKWQLMPNHSDSFNYSNKGQGGFGNKWVDNHPRGWSGPGKTQFSSGHSWLDGQNLIVSSGLNRNNPNKRVFCGYVTSKTTVNFPLFTEVSMKVANSWLSSNFWLLSNDDVNEIDITETYGKDNSNGRGMHTNYHIFQRSPFKDLTPNNGVSHTSEGNVLLKDGFHRFGLHWISKDSFIFYFDGKPVRWLWRDGSAKGLKDPRGRFFDQGMRLIMNLEDHPWRVDRGLTPTDAELGQENNNKIWYNWIRTYKAVPNNTSGGNTGGAPINQVITLKKSGGNKKFVTAENTGSQLIARSTSAQGWEKFRVENHPKGGIALKALSNNKYIQVNNKVQWSPVRNQGNFKGDWERFQWKSKGNGKVSLKSLHSGRWLQASWNQENAIVYPSATNDLGWETFEWSTTSAKKLTPNTSKIYVSPNPVKYVINLHGTTNTDLKLFDAAGNSHSVRAAVTGQNLVTVDAEDLSPGLYFVKVDGVSIKVCKK